MPWRESIADVVTIPLRSCGHIDLGELERQLIAHQNRYLLIGSFSAASNVTGVKSNVPAVTGLLKKYGALSFWDYAAAAPYVGIDVNGAAPIDAIFFSAHKFVGGPGTTGVLVAKEFIFKNTVPAIVGGGTVVYVTPEDHATYERHRPEQTLLYQLVGKHYPALIEQLEFKGKSLPAHVHQEFEAYLKCGRLEHGFLRVRCDGCHFERLVAFSCKKRGFCPSCGARRMAETAALLSDEIFPDVPLRQWVISFPFPLRYLFAAHPQAMGKVLGIIYRTISTHLIHKAGYRLKDGATGAVTLIQRFGSALNLNMPQGTFS